MYTVTTWYTSIFKGEIDVKVSNSRVCWLPNASKLVGFNAAITRELQQLLDIVENGRFVV